MKLKNFSLLIITLCSLTSAYVFAAEAADTPAPNTELPGTVSATMSEATTNTEAETQTPSTNPSEVSKADEAKPQVLDGAGLKSKKLSKVFEDFVPSESISADNAVPFPVDI